MPDSNLISTAAIILSLLALALNGLTWWNLRKARQLREERQRFAAGRRQAQRDWEAHR